MLFSNAVVATMDDDQSGGQPYGLIYNGVVVVEEGVVIWVGPASELPKEHRQEV
jgi:imidazolonepropionase-like amidohydrolase